MASHSRDEPSKDMSEYEDIDEPDELAYSGLKITGVAHSFFLDDYVVPRFCDCCSDLIWGFSRQGYTCEGALPPEEAGSS